MDGDYILDYTVKKMNKIKGQADTKHDSRGKIAAPEIRNEGKSNIIAQGLELSPDMTAAGAAVILDRCEDIVFADDIARDVFNAMIAAAGPSKVRG